VSESKHTPGPWKWNIQDKSSWPEDHSSRIENLEGKIVLNAENDAGLEVVIGVSQADAALIAAAPLMYEALKSWADLFKKNKPAFFLLTRLEGADEVIEETARILGEFNQQPPSAGAKDN